MPKVPVVTGPQVSLDVVRPTPGAMVDAPQFATPEARLRQVAPIAQQNRRFTKRDAFASAYNEYEREPTRYADTKAQTLTGVGQAVSGAANAALDIATRVQLQASALLVDNAVNAAKTLRIRLSDGDGKEGRTMGFRNVLGSEALDRPDGKPLSDEYAERFDEGVKEIATGLKTDAQRVAFAAQAKGERTALYGQAVAHQAQAFREWNLSTQAATIAVESDNIALNYTDPTEIQRSTDRIRRAVTEQAFTLGKSEAWIDFAQKDAVSKAHTTALKTALNEGNIVVADAYLERYKADMTADDVYTVRGVITKEMDERYVIAAADDAVATIAPRANPTELGNFVGVVAKLETGGLETDPKTGKRMTSPKGALGIMQVMPETLKKPGYGIKPSNGTPEDDARVGREYIPAMIQKYSGDPALALAAYNAGPGRVDEAIAEAKKPENRGKSWIDFVPKETQKYVQTGMAGIKSGAGKPAAPTLDEALALVRADPRVNTSPSRLTAAEARVKSRFSEMKYANDQRDEANYATALRAVEANGGNYEALPMGVREAIPADRLSSVRSFATQVKGETTGGAGVATNLAVYQKLVDTNYLRGLTDDQFFALRTELTASDFKNFAELRVKPASDQSAGNLSTGAFDAAMKSNLVSYNLDPKKDAARLGSINKFVREKVYAAQAANGKKFDDATTEAYVNSIFAKETDLRSWTGSAQPTAIMRMSENQLSGEDRTKIRAALKKQGISDPSPEDIMGVFWQMQTRGQ